LFGEDVRGVDEFADAERQASASDTTAESVTKVLETGNALVEIFSPGGRELLPVTTRRRTPLGQGVEGLSDPTQGDAYLL
jgi:hypothetical protein